MQYPSNTIITEVDSRDGLQNEKNPIHQNQNKFVNEFTLEVAFLGCSNRILGYKFMADL